MFHTYIITNRRNGTLYTGHTDDISHRMQQHKCGDFSGFAAKYGCKHLVWFEAHDSREAAFRRERRIKKWNRAWKLHLIEAENPHWLDLAALPVWPLPENPLLPEHQKQVIETHKISR